ncbi:MAG: hypothetical protein NT070_11660, partial [Cyanobacteria bacterium]|nr:hypothetical protein [Cyanobacteriota bacterium]
SFFFSPSISIACITFCRKSELYGFGIVIAQTIRFLSILCPNLAGYSYRSHELWQNLQLV